MIPKCRSCGGDLYHYAGCGIGEHGDLLSVADAVKPPKGTKTVAHTPGPSEDALVAAGRAIYYRDRALPSIEALQSALRAAYAVDFPKATRADQA